MTERPKSQLASLVANVMAEKKAAARQLTPVDGEARPAVLPKAPVPFPNDIPQEVVEQKAAELTRIIIHLTEARDALLKVIEAPLPEKVLDLDAERKQREFAADMRAKEKAAQEAVFTPAASAWACPTHGKPGITKTSAKTGRQFVGCPDCHQFERA